MRHVWPLTTQPGEHLDPGFPNFGIRVSPKGRCVWVIRFSSGTGKERKETSTTLGLVHGVGVEPDGVRILNLRQAHEAAREWLAEQKDPIYAAQQKAEREAAKAKPLTLGDGFAEYKRMRRTKRGEPLAARTIESYEKTFKTHLKKAENWPLLTTGTRAWALLIEEIAKQSPSRAMEALSLVSGIYTHYEVMELPGLTRNPIRNVRRLRVVQAPAKRKTHAPAVHLPKLIAGINAVRNPTSRDVLTCYLLGGFRKSAVMRLRRSIVDLESGVIDVPKGEPGWKGWFGKYPLNSQVWGILHERNKAMAPEHDWFFPARSEPKDHFKDVRGALQTACSGLPTVLMPHDLRRTFGTVCDLVYPGDVAISGALLTHKWALPESPETSITLQYQQRTMEDIRYASETVATAILEIAGILPLSDAIADALRRKGINPAQLELVDDVADEGEE